MSPNYSQIWLHIIFATKNRRPLILRAWKLDLCNHIKEAALRKDYTIDFINVTNNHLHILLNMKPAQSPSKIVADIKGESSFWINKSLLSEIDDKFEWQKGYSVFSIDYRNINPLRDYIKFQKFFN